MAKRAPITEKNITQAAEALGMTGQAVGQWADKAPPDMVRAVRGVRWLKWPDFPVWYRQQLKQKERPADLDEARARKLAAEAELAELELERARGTLYHIDDVAAVWRDMLRRIAAQGRAAAGRYAVRTVGLSDLRTSTAVWEEAMGDVMRDLQGKDDARAVLTRGRD